MSECEICGAPMPEGEELFRYHGHSGPCPQPPKSKPKSRTLEDKVADLEVEVAALKMAVRQLLMKDAYPKVPTPHAIPRAVKGLDASDPIGG